MLRKFLIPTVIVSILLLLTTLISITQTEATSVATSETTTTTAAKNTTSTTTKATSKTSATVLQKFTETSAVNKFLNNAASAASAAAAGTTAEETTTSLLPLQPPLNVTSTTLASFILNQKHQKQKQQLQQEQQQRQKKQQQQKPKQQQPGQRHQTQYRHVQVVENKQQFQPDLLNDNVNDNKEIKKKNLDSAIVTVTSAVDIITPEPTSTHAYIPFELDYNDPTEEKAAGRQENGRQSTINEVLTNLFPKGFSDIFRFSYAEDAETPTTTIAPIIIRKSTPAPFKPMPTSINQEEIFEEPKEIIPSATAKTKISTTTTTIKPTEQIYTNKTFVTMTTSVTRETRREISPGHTEIVVEKIITEPNSYKSNEDFRDGSNSISKDELLRINRAAKEASVLPSLLVNPEDNSTSTNSSNITQTPIVILNENNDNDDFVDAPEDDNQIAESQSIVHQVYQKPPAESSNFQVSQNHQYNVRIIHDEKPNNQDNSEAHRNAPSYQSFVEQSSNIQNSLKEAPSRKFLKNFHHPIQSQESNPQPVAKGNFHYEHNGAQSHIQTVPPAAQLQYVQYHQQQQHSQQQQQHQQQEPYQQQSNQQQQQLHTHITDSQPLSDKDVYQIVEFENKKPQTATPVNLVFVTINTPPPPTHETPKQSLSYTHESLETPSSSSPSKTIKSPHEFVSEAVGHNSQKLLDHQTEETENQPKPSNAGGGGGYTFVEVQKSINIHNKLITEKDGHLIEQHETIYPEHKYRDRLEPQSHLPPATEIKQDYDSLSQNPIHVEQLEDHIPGEPHELAASLRAEQHAINPSQDITADIGPIQQSNLVQESHIIEIPQHGEEQHQGSYNNHQLTPQENHHESYIQNVEAHEHQHHHQQDHEDQQEIVANAEHSHHQEDYKVIEEVHDKLAEPSQDPYQPPIQIPYALPPEDHHHHNHHQQQHYYHHPHQHAVVVEKHIPIPYAVPEPVEVPVHIQHFIDRPYPVETIVEMPVPYPVEKVVEKVVEKHVPVEVEKIVEKPVEKIVNKYIDRPVAIPIKIPVAIQMPASMGHQLYGPTPPHYPLTFGGSDYGDHATPFSPGGGGGSFARVPTKVLQSYYTKMLKKLVPKMQQAYKNSQTIAKPKPVLKQTPKQNYNKLNYKISDMLYDLKPPPARPRGSNWDKGARYQYDYNTLPLDLSASASVDSGKQLERPGGQGYKTNFDEFQRWRNGHNLKRSPDFGRNLHVEYGFKPPLVPSVEIDDKGVPLKAVADLTNGKDE